MNNRHSLLSKVLLILLSATLLEGALFLGSLFMSKTFSNIKENAISLFEQRSSFRSSNLQKMLIDDLYKETNYSQLMQDCQKLYEEKNSFNGSNEQLEKQTLEDLLEVIRLRTVTGAYIILDKDVFQSDSYPTLYLKDSSPDTIYNDNSDISGRFGNATLLKNRNLTLESSWTPAMQIDSNDETYSFYTKPYEMAKQNPGLNPMDYGYWGDPIALDNDAQEVITYSFPLIANDGTVFGIIGIDATTAQLKNLLDYSELNSGGRTAYVLAKKNGDTYTSILYNGPAYSYLFKQSTILTLEDKIMLDTYEISLDGSDSILAHASKLELYNRNTPFSEEDWYLIGISDEKQLLKSGSTLARNSYIAAFLALLIGIGAAILISMKFSNPIRKLIFQLKHINANTTVKLPRVNINEIDELSTSIEELSLNLMGAEDRLSQVIHALELPIGAIEDFGKDTYYCTEKVAELLDFPLELHHKSVLNKTIFNEALAKFNSHAILLEEHQEVKDDKNISYYVVRYQTYKGKNRWIRFTYSDQKENRVFVIMDVTKEFKEKEILTYERDHDALTGLMNRNAFQQAVEKLLTQDSQVSAMVLWDLDNLKYINDTYGHNYGDLLIQTTAQILSKVNEMNGIASRMAGDEFLIFLHHYQSKDQLFRIIQKIHMQIINTKLHFREDEATKIKVSAGIAWYPDDADDYDTLMKYSDFAMYDVKNSQKGSIRNFDPTIYQHNKLLFNGRKELNDLLESNIMRYAFQPIIDAKTGEIHGFEALMRPQGSILTSPQDVLRLARAQAQLYKVEFMTWTMSIQQFTAMNDAFPDCKLFINSIPSIPLLDDLISKLEKEYAQQLSNIVVELLETDEIEKKYLQIKQEFMAKWHGRFAIDDFGSGYNSDTTLLKLDADYIKIDIELIRNIDQDLDRKTMVKNIIEIAHQKKIEVIAEGVERKEEMELLIQMNVDYLQGYYLAKPAFELKDIPEHLKEEIRLAQI